MGETRGGPKCCRGIEQSRFQFSQSLRAEERGQKVPRSLARSGMRDLITGAINEGSNGRRSCRGLRSEKEPQKRAIFDERTDGRTSKDLPPPPSPSDVVRVQPAEKPTVCPSGRRRRRYLSAAAAAGRKSTVDGSGVMPRAKPVCKKALAFIRVRESEEAGIEIHCNNPSRSKK